MGSDVGSKLDGPDTGGCCGEAKTCPVSKLSLEAPRCSTWDEGGGQFEADSGHLHDGSNTESVGQGLFGPGELSGPSKLAIALPDEGTEAACSFEL